MNGNLSARQFCRSFFFGRNRFVWSGPGTSYEVHTIVSYKVQRSPRILQLPSDFFHLFEEFLPKWWKTMPLLFLEMTDVRQRKNSGNFNPLFWTLCWVFTSYHDNNSNTTIFTFVLCFVVSVCFPGSPYAAFIEEEWMDIPIFSYYLSCHWRWYERYIESSTVHIDNSTHTHTHALNAEVVRQLKRIDHMMRGEKIHEVELQSTQRKCQVNGIVAANARISTIHSIQMVIIIYTVVEWGKNCFW